MLVKNLRRAGVAAALMLSAVALALPPAEPAEAAWALSGTGGGKSKASSLAPPVNPVGACVGAILFLLPAGYEVTWQKSGGTVAPDTYQVETASDATQVWVVRQILDRTAAFTVRIDVGLLNGGTHTARVKAVRGNWTSPTVLTKKVRVNLLACGLI